MFSKTEVNYLKPYKKAANYLTWHVIEVYLFYWLQNFPVNLPVSLKVVHVHLCDTDPLIHFVTLLYIQRTPCIAGRIR